MANVVSKAANSKATETRRARRAAGETHGGGGARRRRLAQAAGPASMNAEALGAAWNEVEADAGVSIYTDPTTGDRLVVKLSASGESVAHYIEPGHLPDRLVPIAASAALKLLAERRSAEAQLVELLSGDRPEAAVLESQLGWLKHLGDTGAAVARGARSRAEDALAEIDRCRTELALIAISATEEATLGVGAAAIRAAQVAWLHSLRPAGCTCSPRQWVGGSHVGKRDGFPENCPHVATAAPTKWSECSCERGADGRPRCHETHGDDVVRLAWELDPLPAPRRSRR